MISNPASISIKDESTDGEKRYQLYVDGDRRGLVTKPKARSVKIHWQTEGSFSLSESKVWMSGMFELMLIADQLKSGIKVKLEKS